MQRWKNILYNSNFALNCMLLFLLIFENRLSLPPWVQTFGRMHPLLLHFPIVLMLLTIGSELFASLKKSNSEEWIFIGDGLLLLTSFTSVLSALMGLLLSREDGYTQEIVVWHKWGGVFISFLSFAWYTYRNRVRKMKVVLVAASLAALVMVIFTGHLGADITHGDDFLLAPVLKDKAALKVLLEDAVVYTDMVQPILQSKCITCHNERKAKGELIMESFASLVKGGKNGILWDLNKPDLGLLLSRIHLPLESKKHMPPSGKPQLTDEEKSILYHWIKNGANDTAKVTALPETDTLRTLAASIFNTIETDDYTFKPADENKVKALRNNYRLVAPLAEGSPALGVTFFSAAQFKSEQLKELLPVKVQIVSLNLNKMPVTDNDLATIAQFTNLRKLNLSFTNVKGSNLSVLNSLRELKQLSVSGTGVTTANLTAISSLPKLTELYIWNTPAQSANLIALKKQFKNTQVLTGFKGDTITIKLNPPLVENEEQIIVQPLLLKLKHFVKGTVIHYTTNGTEPDSLLSPIFKDGFMIDKNMTVKAKAFKPGWISSDIAEKTFYRAGYRIDSIRLLQPALDEPYKSIKATILTDSKKGETDFRSGKWIGFRGAPMQAVMYFDTVKSISSVTVSGLVDIGAFIMPPQQVEVWAGNDAANLRLIKKINPPQPSKSVPSYMKGYEINFDVVKEKYVKVVVVPVGKLPVWHQGKGDKGWVFVDEIFLN